MSNTATRLLLCDCTGTMAPDAAAIEAGTGLACARVHTHLCRAEAAQAANALRSGDPVLIACGQEAPGFAALAEDLGAADRLGCVDIRDRAGWAEAPAGPKMAALIADARLPAPRVPAFDIESEGICLVYGHGQQAVDAAARLAGALSVTAMLVEPDEIMGVQADIDVVTGRIRTLTGALGRFALTADRFAELEPAGRGPRRFGAPRDGAQSECDLILDLSGGVPLVPAAHKRDGYLRADPGDPIAVERALFDAAQLIGSFEKPLYVRLTESLCAHSRAGQTGCTRCLDLCPTGAITPNGDHIAIDAHICAGCGACHAVCPSGAAAFDDPPVAHLFARMRTMAEAYAKAGGTAPRLLVHDEHGAEMIRLAARYGRGLPAAVIPLALPSLGIFGHAEQIAALALGYAAVDILAGPRTERAPLEAEIALTDAILAGATADSPTSPACAPSPLGGEGAGRLRLLDPADPDALADLLHAGGPEPLGVEPILAAGGRRETVRVGARALAGGATDAAIALPDGAPYGRVHVDTDACTLCMACAGLCPTGALLDNPDRPELSFREEACIQCGLCANLCPERAITLEPRLDLSEAALQPRILNEEEPFACIECGKLFGVKSTIEKITAKLAGSHALFSQSDNVRLIQMCDDCRVRAQYHQEAAPFRFGERPGTRTTDDYLAERGDGTGEDR